MKSFLTAVGGIVVAGLLIVGTVILGLNSTWFHNTVNRANQKIDDATNYDTLKQVEGTCRAMIASYNSDKLTYEQYRTSDNAEKQSWAEQAKMRANKTASTYNNYIIKNSYIWKDNVPEDIYMTLSYLE